MAGSTRERILDEALRLFAERGYAATAVAEIEAASGLSPGAGGLYRHFRSKEEVLAAAVHEHVSRTRDQIEQVSGKLATVGSAELTERLRVLARLGLAKMTAEADLTRVLFRDLDKFPHLVAEVRDQLVQPLYQLMSGWGEEQPEFARAGVDWPAVAAVLGGAIVNYWLACAQLGAPPGCVEEDRFVEAWVRLCHGLLAVPAPSSAITLG